MSLANLDLSVSLLSFQSKKQDHKLPKVFKVGDIVNTAKYTLVIVKIVTNKSFFGIIIC